MMFLSKLKQPYKTILLVVGILIVLHSVLANTGILTIYKSPTIANEPAIKSNTYFLVSNLPKIKKRDIISFKHIDQFLGEHQRIYRLVAKGNDTVEIIDGVLFVNGQNFDQNLALIHLYVLNRDETKNLLKEKIIKNSNLMMFKGDEFLISLPDDVAKEKGFLNRLKLKPKNEVDKSIMRLYGKEWNIDHFGPLTIPQGKYFVMGDNRPNAEDSRYIGFIDEADVLGKVVFILD